MNIIFNRTFLILLLITTLIIGCNNKVSNGPIVGKVDGESLNITLSTEKIQGGLNALFSQSDQGFIVKTAGIIKYQDLYFLKIIGHSYQKCMIPLTEQDGILYETIPSDIPIILCTGCDHGCEPVLIENSWYCSDGCDDCMKSVTVSDQYMFE